MIHSNQCVYIYIYVNVCTYYIMLRVCIYVYIYIYVCVYYIYIGLNHIDTPV